MGNTIISFFRPLPETEMRQLQIPTPQALTQLQLNQTLPDQEPQSPASKEILQRVHQSPSAGALLLTFQTIRVRLYHKRLQPWLQNLQKWTCQSLPAVLHPVEVTVRVISMMCQML